MKCYCGFQGLAICEECGKVAKEHKEEGHKFMPICPACERVLYEFTYDED